jgi:hypothetical protein
VEKFFNVLNSQLLPWEATKKFKTPEVKVYLAFHISGMDSNKKRCIVLRSEQDLNLT